MNSSELAEACREIYGGYGWQTKLARDLDVDGSTVRRWVSGAVPTIPGPVAAAVRCFLDRKRAPDSETPTIPTSGSIWTTD